MVRFLILRFVLILTLIVGLGASGVAFGIVGQSKAQEPVTLVVTDTQVEGGGNAAIEQIYANFMAEYPHITNDRQPVSYEQITQLIPTALASGTGPDVFTYDAAVGSAGVLAEAGLLLPLDELAAEYGHDWQESHLPIALREGTFQGTLYGLGNELEFAGFFYNQTLLNELGLELPETFDEVIQFCGAASEAGYIPLAHSQAGVFQWHMFAGVLNNLIGPEAVVALLYEGEGSWDSPQVVKAIETFFVDLTEAGCFIDDVNALTGDDAEVLFNSGQAIILPVGTWAVGDIEEATAETGYEIGLMPFPAIEGGVGRYYPAAVGSAFYISAATEHPEEAALLIDYMFAPESVRLWVEEARYIPPVAFDVSEYEMSPLFGEVVDIALSAVSAGDVGGSDVLGYFVNHATPAEFLTTMTQGFQAVVAGSKTAEQQAQDLQAAWESWESAPGS